MQNTQKQKTDNKNVLNNDDNKLKPTYFPGQQGTGDQWILVLMISPIIILTSPVWIPYLIAGFVQRKIGNVDKKIQILQNQISSQHSKFHTKKINHQNISYINQQLQKTFPILILKHKSKLKYSQMMVFVPRYKYNRKHITRWQQIQKQFKEKIYKFQNSKKNKQSLFFYAGNELLNGLFSIEDIYNKWKHSDGLLYIRYEKLEVYG